MLMSNLILWLASRNNEYVKLTFMTDKCNALLFWFITFLFKNRTLYDNIQSIVKFLSCDTN